MEYRVLARKYRPADFDALIGQELLVRTLSNAIASGRIAHAFLLTGIRGVGKTTTARIIARALNCTGSDGRGGATISPCGACSNCMMIAEGRHPDVLEMDAASHTGVGDIRELIDAVRYLPSAARYKIYIIDEVHMLSTSAFNALLKTLEEPPPHVKFVFATTEARKIPVTILSRCQRFDLKRVSQEDLAGHIGRIAAKESVGIEPQACTLIAVSAEGSVRDALSLLDQAIARDGEGGITAASVRQMIGSADNAATFRLLGLLLSGQVAEALDEAKRQYTAGVDPLLMVQDALEVTHLLTRAKLAPQALEDVTLSESDRASAGEMAGKLAMPALTRLWQMLLKGLGELRGAPSPLAALEMLLVRIAYAAQLPTPAEAIRQMKNSDTAHSPSPVGGGPGQERAGMPAASSAPVSNSPRLERSSQEPLPHPGPPATGEGVTDFPALVALFEQKREMLLHTQLKQDVRLVAFEPGRLEIRLTAPLGREFLSKVAELLTRWTGQPWKVALSEAEGNPSLHEVESLRKQKRKDEAAAHPLVASIFEQFPGAELAKVESH